MTSIGPKFNCFVIGRTIISHGWIDIGGCGWIDMGGRSWINTGGIRGEIAAEAVTRAVVAVV